jgi:ornithine cyclodeaminase/alanine dehydrogenase-like protein (mu-crystallin family)
MTVLLDLKTLDGVISMRDAINLLDQAARHEAAGRTVASPRTHVDFERGSMRILMAADHEAGYLATKAYNRIEGAGVRYVVSLYSLKNGELLAILDGQIITNLRTGAASGVIARRVPLQGTITVGIIGSGNQARAQLESLAAVYKIKYAVVYSPNVEHREAYAHTMSVKLGLPVTAVDSAETAARGRSVVATASRSRSKEPVLKGEWLQDCRLLCAVGNTRKQFSEVEAQAFRNASLVVVDAPNAFDDTGELVQAAQNGGIREDKRATLAQIVSGTRSVPEQGLIAFKSVGTALQDLALAVRYYELLGAHPGLPGIADFAGAR